MGVLSVAKIWEGKTIHEVKETLRERDGERRMESEGTEIKDWGVREIK